MPPFVPTTGNNDDAPILPCPVDTTRSVAQQMLCDAESSSGGKAKKPSPLGDPYDSGDIDMPPLMGGGGHYKDDNDDDDADDDVWMKSLMTVERVDQELRALASLGVTGDDDNSSFELVDNSSSAEILNLSDDFEDGYFVHNVHPAGANADAASDAIDSMVDLGSFLEKEYLSDEDSVVDETTLKSHLISRTSLSLATELSGCLPFAMRSLPTFVAASVLSLPLSLVSELMRRLLVALQRPSFLLAVRTPHTSNFKIAPEISYSGKANKATPRSVVVEEYYTINVMAYLLMLVLGIGAEGLSKILGFLGVRPHIGNYTGWNIIRDRYGEILKAKADEVCCGNMEREAALTRSANGGESLFNCMLVLEFLQFF